ncbi:MAG: hypothetical protein E3J83_03355 [Candidatus Atribacteria bacterium]|nr:MAG: hypothetical protein E3J83_03355 [Candidatus Atribacteria bacterium]
MEIKCKNCGKKQELTNEYILGNRGGKPPKFITFQESKNKFYYYCKKCYMVKCKEVERIQFLPITRIIRNIFKHTENSNKTNSEKATQRIIKWLDEKGYFD